MSLRCTATSVHLAARLRDDCVRDASLFSRYLMTWCTRQSFTSDSWCQTGDLLPPAPAIICATLGASRSSSTGHRAIFSSRHQAADLSLTRGGTLGDHALPRCRASRARLRVLAARALLAARHARGYLPRARLRRRIQVHVAGAPLADEAMTLTPTQKCCYVACAAREYMITLCELKGKATGATACSPGARAWRSGTRASRSSRSRCA